LLALERRLMLTNFRPIPLSIHQSINQSINHFIVHPKIYHRAGGVAQWLERRSLAGGLYLIDA